MKINIYVANESHQKYAEEIVDLMYISAQERGTGIVQRSPEYVKRKNERRQGRLLSLKTEPLQVLTQRLGSHTKFVAKLRSYCIAPV